MTLGALVAIVVIALGAMQLPRLFKAKAGGGEQTAQQAASAATNSSSPATQPANASTSQQPPLPPVSEPASPPEGSASQGATTASQPGQPTEQLQGSNNPMTQTPPAGGSKKRLARASQSETTAHNGQMNQAGGQAGQTLGEVAAPSNQAAQAAAREAAAAKELEELGDRMTPLAGRANAVKDSVEHLRQQQERAGFSLRHDISASLSSMEQYMGKADAALNSRNPEAAKKYMDLAEREIEKLEKFFGR
jgi:serine/threonine-protein kinase